MQTDAKRLWKLNEALSLGVLSPAAALYAPLAPPAGSRGLPHLHWQPDRAFHTSALCATALDGITLPYRLHSPSPTSPLGMATGAPLTNLMLVHLALQSMVRAKICFNRFFKHCCRAISPWSLGICLLWMPQNLCTSFSSQSACSTQPSSCVNDWSGMHVKI